MRSHFQIQFGLQLFFFEETQFNSLVLGDSFLHTLLCLRFYLSKTYSVINYIFTVRRFERGQLIEKKKSLD